MNSFPNYFSSISSNFDEQLHQFKSQSKLRFLQIGVYTGDASVYILNQFSHVEDFILIDVDTWKSGDSKEMETLDFARIEEIYLQRTQRDRNRGRVESLKITSDKFFASNDAKFDFIYIDGSHEPIQILKDGLNAFESLNSRGILAFDDYLGAGDKPFKDRPKFAIDLFFELLSDRIELVKSNYQLWIKKLGEVQDDL